jgi:hypothetical protein
MVVDDSGRMHARNILQRTNIHVKTFAVFVVAEVVEPGVVRGPGVQHVGVERALGCHRRSLAGDVREMVRRSTGVLTIPAARAAMPGLLAEMATDPTLHAKLLERFGEVTSRGMTDRLDAAMSRGEVRSDVTAADLVEAIAGMALMAIITRNHALDDAWVERTATLITRGIKA